MLNENSLPRSAGGAVGLDRKFVTCRDVFESETKQVFSRNWICVAHVDELDKKSRCLPIWIEGHSLVIVEDGHGTIRVFRNFCRHRGSQLVGEDNCSSVSKRIQCPYHAWTYERNGNLVSAPNMDGIHSFDVTDYSLISLPTEVIGGLVFVRLSTGDEASASTTHPPVAALADHLDAWQVEKLRIADQIDYEVEANWKLIFQNYSECYHCPTVHPALNRLTPFLGSSNELTDGPVLGGPMGLSSDSQTMSNDGKLVGELLPKLNQEQKRSVSYFTIFPSLFLSFHPDYLLIHRLERVTVSKTRVICQFLFPASAVEQSGFSPSRAVEFWDLTNRQDWHVCELAQQGMKDPGYVPGPYSNLESIVAAFDNHYRDVMSTD